MKNFHFPASIKTKCTVFTMAGKLSVRLTLILKVGWPKERQTDGELRCWNKNIFFSRFTFGRLMKRKSLKWKREKKNIYRLQSNIMIQVLKWNKNHFLLFFVTLHNFFHQFWFFFFSNAWCIIIFSGKSPVRKVRLLTWDIQKYPSIQNDTSSLFKVDIGSWCNHCCHIQCLDLN